MGAALALGAFGWWLASRPVEVPALELPPVVAAAAAVPAAASPRAPPAPLRPASESLAPSLRGTELDGEIGVGPGGHLRIDVGLRRRFDHLLSSLGERTLAELRSGFAAQLTPSVGALARTEALAAWDRYVAYLHAVDALEGGATLAHLEALHALRERELGPEMARAFFEAEEAADRFALEQRAGGGGALEPEGRKALTASLAELRAVQAQTQALEAANATAAEKLAARTKTHGADVAAQLGSLDDERARWSRKLAALEAVANEPAKFEAMLAKDFTEPEARRARAVLGR